ncbi:MAG: alpha/beta fold hydrolase [Lachnospiraceae bacterium]|nr:alpha/beta fold hydrolase [Lachnospiraceae bacterium]
MNTENYTFQSSDNEKTTIHGVKWTPDDGEVKAVIQLNHGMIEYIERYAEFAEYLTKRGFVVMGHDHIGHGESVRSSADWGIMHTDTPSDTMVEDMFTNYRIIRGQYPDKPFFILGHSMGSYLLRMFLSKKANQLEGVNGAIVMGTGTVDKGAISAGSAVCKLIALFRGWDYKSKFVAGLMFDANYKCYDVCGNDVTKSWLSRNEESVKEYYSNPKTTFAFSLNGYRTLLEATSFDNDMNNINKMRKDMPILFVSGDKDPVGAMGEGVKIACNKFIEAGIKDVSMKLYPDDRHEILNDLDRETVYADIYQWMAERL